MFSYEQLEKLYQQAEQYIPTRFKDYQERSREHYFFVKNNYYYLFEMAEMIKKQFFQSKFRYELYVSTNKDTREGTVYLDRWKLSICVDGRFDRTLLRREVRAGGATGIRDDKTDGTVL